MCGLTDTPKRSTPEWPVDHSVISPYNDLTYTWDTITELDVFSCSPPTETFDLEHPTSVGNVWKRGV